MKRRFGMLRARVRHLFRMPRGIGTVAAQAAGVAGLAYGTWQVYEPAAWIGGGVGLLLWAWGGGEDGDADDGA